LIFVRVGRGNNDEVACTLSEMVQGGVV
jgi:hypothetical protein